MTITIEDVARHAGVSDATVSRVLSNKPHVRAEVRERVLHSVEVLGYRPSRVARSLRARRSSIIGLIISDIQNPFFTALVRAVEDIANANQHAIFLCNTDEDPEKEKLYLELMLSEHVAGVLITPTRENGSHLKKLSDAGIPVVVFDRYISDIDIDTVIVDNFRGGFALTQHLIDMGHRRIGAVIHSTSITTGRERREGYVAALKTNGLPVERDLIETDAPNDTLACKATQKILSLPQPPTALITGNIVVTGGALRAIRNRGLEMPRDIALAAYDEAVWSSLMVPALTTMEQPTYEIGRIAAELLLQRIDDNSRPRQRIVLQPQIHIRQSSGAPSGTSEPE